VSPLVHVFHPGWRGHATVALVVRLYLGWLFVAASWHKLLDPASFALDVATYQFLPRALINLFALVVPWVEILAGILVIVGYRARAAMLLIALLMVSFLIALLYALFLGLDMSCGCFASQSAASDDAISWRTVARDLGWLALSLYALFYDRNPLGLERFLSRKVDTSCHEPS